MLPSEKNRRKTRGAVTSITSNVSLVVLKYVVGFASGSAAIVSEGTHSLSDLIAAGLAWFAVRKASEPADEEHPFGHEKYESISGFAEGLLIIAAAVAIVVEAVLKLLHGTRVQNVDWCLAIMGFSAILNVFVSSYLKRIARETESLALEADAEHLRTDVYTSAGVFVGLAIGRFTGWHWMDPLVAIAVAVAIVSAGVRIVGESLKHLLDAALPEEEEAAIQHLLDEHADLYLEYHDLRTRKAGHVRHIDLHLVMDGNLTLNQAHDLSDELECDIKELLPGAHVMIHVEPHTEALGASAVHSFSVDVEGR